MNAVGKPSYETSCDGETSERMFVTNSYVSVTFIFDFAVVFSFFSDNLRYANSRYRAVLFFCSLIHERHATVSQEELQATQTKTKQIPQPIGIKF